MLSFNYELCHGGTFIFLVQTGRNWYPNFQSMSWEIYKKKHINDIPCKRKSLEPLAGCEIMACQMCNVSVTYETTNNLFISITH